MPIYTEKVKNDKGKMADKIVDGKKQYYIRTYVTDEYGNSKQIKRHNKKWLGRDGYNLALREEARLKGEIILKEEKKRNITVKQLKKMYIENIRNSVDKDTLSNAETCLDHFCEIDKTNQVKTFPNSLIIKITKKDYSEWQTQMKNKIYYKGKNKRKYSIQQLNRINNTISRMIDYAIVEGYCTINFVKQCGKIGTPKEIKLSQKPKEYEVITFEEYKRLMSSTKDNIKYNTLFDLWFSRGMRAGEVRAFQIKDFNKEKKQLMVNHTMSKKNELKEPKTVSSKAPIDLDDTLIAKIEKLIDISKECKGFNNDWFLFGAENPISTHALDYNKDKYFKKANINKHLRLHDLRHSCASWLFSENIPITVISKILRHKDISETMKTYTHLLKDDYIRGLNRINEIKYGENKSKNKSKNI